MAGSEEANGRVTLAVLSTKPDIVVANQEELKRGRQVHHDRIATLEGHLEPVREGQSVVTLAVSAFNMVAASVAAWVWTRR